MKKLSFLAAILICGLICTTCDLFKDAVKEPTVTLDSINYSAIDFNGLTLLSNVKVQNNMSLDIPFPQIDVDLGLFDIVKPFLSFSLPSGGTLKSSDFTVIPVPTTFDFEGLFNLVAKLTDKDQRENPMYKIKLTTHIPIQGHDFTIPLESEGLLPLIKVPDIKFASPPKASLTYGSGLLGLNVPNGGKIEFSLNVKNNSNIAVLVNELSYDLKIGSTSLKGGVESKPNIEKDATTELKFTLPLEAAQAVSIVGNVLSGGGLSNLSFTGNYKLGLPEFPLIKEFGDSFTVQ